MNAFEAEFEAEKYDIFMHSRESAEESAADLAVDEAGEAVVPENDTDNNPYEPPTIINQPFTTTNDMDAIEPASEQGPSKINSQGSDIPVDGLLNGMPATDSSLSAEDLKTIWSSKENVMSYLHEYEIQQVAQGYNAWADPMMRSTANIQPAAATTDCQGILLVDGPTNRGPSSPCT
jgi:hypothetical protein